MTSSDFDRVIQRVYEATGIDSQAELANVLRINRSAVTQARKKGAVPDKWLLQLYRQFGLNPEWLERGDGPAFLIASAKDESEFEKIPKYKARLCAGDGSFEDDAEVQGFYSFRKGWLRKKGSYKQMVLLDVFGNSMEPEIKDGDTVLLDQSQKDIIAGTLYAIGIEDTIMVKRMEKRPNKLVLLSNHKDYPPIILGREDADMIRIIGKVIWVCREIH